MKLLERLKNWYHSWPQSPVTYDYDAEEVHHCLNCGLDYVGNFCPRCAQNAKVGRITWRSLLNSFLELWDFTSRSVPSTLVQLVYRPGYVINDYLHGRRQMYFPPVKLLVVVALVTAVAQYWLFPHAAEEYMTEFVNGMRRSQAEARTQQNPEDTLNAAAAQLPMEGKVVGNASDEMADSAMTDADLEEAAIMQSVQEAQDNFTQMIEMAVDWSTKNEGWTMLITCSFLILPTRRLFRRAPRNGKHTLPEGFFIQTYLSSTLVLLSFLNNMSSVFSLGLPVYYYFAYHQLFGYGRWSTFWRTAVALLTALISFFALFMLGVLGYIIISVSSAI